MKLVLTFAVLAGITIGAVWVYDSYLGGSA